MESAASPRAARRRRDRPRSGRLGGAASTVFGRQRSRPDRQPAGAATPGATSAVGSEPPSPQQGWTPPEGFEQAAHAHGVGAPGTGLRNPSWREIKDHVPVELAAAAARERSTTRGDVARAIRSLSPEARQGVMSLMESNGGQIRGQMAHQAARGDLTDTERDAFRTLAAASPEVRTQGIGDFDGAGANEHPAVPTPPDGAPAPAWQRQRRAPDEAGQPRNKRRGLAAGQR